MNEIKPFSKKLYDENVPISRKVSSEFLSQVFGFHVVENKKTYKYDLIVEDFFTKEKKTVEVELKRVWTSSGCWQGWNTLDIPFRKEKSDADLFIMFNLNCDTLAYTKMAIVKNSRVEEKKTCYTSSGTERFYRVPLSEVLIFAKSQGRWKLLPGFGAEKHSIDYWR